MFATRTLRRFCIKADRYTCKRMYTCEVIFCLELLLNVNIALSGKSLTYAGKIASR